MAKSPEEALQTMIANMVEKTGRSLQDWLGVVGTTDTHRVRVHSVDEVDAELIGWLEAAYELA